MASAQVVTIYICDICETKNDVEWKCVDCDEIMCLTCKTVHSKSKISRDHNIIDLFSEQSEQAIRKSESDTKCVYHPTEVYQRFCKSCDCLVCFECVTSNHNGHTFLKTPEVVELMRTELSNKIDECKTETILKLSEALEKTKHDQEIYCTEIDRLVNEINQRAEALKAEVDDIRDEFIQILQAKARERNGALHELKNHLEQNITKLRKFIETTEETIRTMKGIRFIRIFEESKAIVPEASNCNVDEINVGMPHFVPSENNSRELRKVFGNLTNMNTAVETSDIISNSNPAPKSMAKIESSYETPGEFRQIVLGEDEMWLGSGVGGSLALVTFDGREKETIQCNSNPEGMALTQSGELIFTCFQGKAIRKLTLQHKIVNFINTSPYFPSGLCITKKNDILATLKGSSVPKVVRFSNTGKQLQTIQYNTDGSQLLRNPWFLTQNENGDIWIVDKDGPSYVIVLDKTGNIKFRYTGHSTTHMKQPFLPKDLICDKFGRVVITDWNNKCLHLVSKIGEFINFIPCDNETIGKPFGAAVDAQGRLWITHFLCEKTWNVSCIKYLD